MSTLEKEIPEYEVDDIAEFMRVVQDLTGPEKKLFRGQRFQWKLKPKIGRLKPRNGTILDAEQQMLSDFKRKSVPLLSCTPENNLEWLAIAQHHGLATRLMDWTENPMAGLWFAVRNPPEHEDEDLQPGVVWCLKVPEDRILPQEPAHEIETDVFGAKKSMVYRPRHIASRITAQAGWFTVHHFETKSDRFGVFEWHPIFKGNLTKINIPGARFPYFRTTLASMGTNDATMFPDLVGLCDQIEREHSLAEDETVFQKPFSKVAPKKTVKKATSK